MRRLSAVIESGAPRSMFPRGIAETSLGVGLIQGPMVEGVEETRFPSWYSSTPIAGQVLRIHPDGEIEEWGPEFALAPAFTDKGSFVLGRADFFAQFTITFDPPRYGSGPSFTLECD